MGKLTLVYILFLFINVDIALSQNDLQNKYEKKVYSCIIDKYSDAGISIIQELSKYEAYLIENKFLDDSTGKSYEKLYKTLLGTNEIPVYQEYKIEGLDTVNYELFSNCIDSELDNISLNNSIKQLHNVFTKINHPEEFFSSNLNNELVKLIIEENFNNKLFKLYALFNLYCLTFPLYNTEINLLK